MKRLFGGKSKPVPKKDTVAQKQTMDEAIGKMDSRQAALDEKIRRLEAELLGLRQKMQQTRNPSAKKAIMNKAKPLLQRKRMYERQREQYAAQSFNLEQASFSIETAKSAVTMVETMKDTTDALRETQKTFDIDTVEDMRDEMEDLMFDQEEIQEVVSRAYGVPDDLDEADLEAELAGLEDEWGAEDMLDSMPSYLPEPSGGETVPARTSGVTVDEFGCPLTTT